MGRILTLLRLIATTLIEWVIVDIPGPLGRRVRRLYWRTQMRHIGKNVQIDVGVRFVSPQHISIGNNVWIDNYAIIIAGPPTPGDGPFLRRDDEASAVEPGEIIIGDNVHIANFVVIQGHGGVKVGSNSGIASGCMIYSMSHHHWNLLDSSDKRKYKFTPMVDRKDQSLLSAPVILGDDCAVALHTIVLPGTRIGAGSWIAAASVVSGKLPPNVLAAGNPARIIRRELHPGWLPDVDT